MSRWPLTRNSVLLRLTAEDRVVLQNQAFLAGFLFRFVKEIRRRQSSTGASHNYKIIALSGILDAKRCLRRPRPVSDAPPELPPKCSHGNSCSLATPP